MFYIKLSSKYVGVGVNCALLKENKSGDPHFLFFFLIVIILPMLSYPGRQVTSSCEIASKRIHGLLEAFF